MRTPTGLVRLTGGFVSENYFELLGARAFLGRALMSGDADNPDVIVLGFYTWQRHFGSDAAVIGSIVEFRTDSARRSAMVVGVMPESMETLGSPMDFYATIVNPPTGRPVRLASLIGRLRHGVSVLTASQEADRIGSAVRPPRPASAPALTRRRFEAQNLTRYLQAALYGVTPLHTATFVMVAVAFAGVAALASYLPARRATQVSPMIALGGQ